MKTCLTFLFLITSGQIWGQISNTDLQSEDEIIGSYDYFYNNPLDLNHCSKEELSQIQFLTSEQVNAFIQYRENQVSLLHVYELQIIEHWDLGTCRKISELVYVQLENKKAINIVNSQMLIRVEETLEKAIGFQQTGKTSDYKGNRLKQFIKFKNTSQANLKFGMISQKDAGENNWLDFYSAYVEFRPNRHIQKIIIGDFSVQWGQGLLQAGGFNLGKNYESIKSTQKFHIGAIPYSSSAEYSFNRGIFLQKIISKQLSFQTFGSNKWLDGKLYAVQEQWGYKSIDTDGYHRNNTELANQQTIHEVKWGNSLQIITSPQSTLQFNSIFTTYNVPKIPSGIDYKLNEWTGNTFTLWSVSQTSTFKNTRFVNEVALQSFNKFSIVHGAAISVSKKQDYSYLLRYFKSGFYNPDGKALGENTKNENELGIFIGQQVQISKRKRLSSYLDIFYFPEIKYQVSSPKTLGWELLNRYQMERKNSYKFFHQIKWTSKEEDFAFNKTDKKLQRTHDLQESVDVSIARNKWIQWHQRLMLHFLHKNELSFLGAMLLQDLEVNFPKLQVKTRIAYIHTPNYDTRLYAFEQGLPFSFNLLAYSGHAFRMALTADLPLNKLFTLSTKIGRTIYLDKNEIGSSTDLIQGNHKTDLSLQLVYKNL